YRDLIRDGWCYWTTTNLINFNALKDALVVDCWSNGRYPLKLYFIRKREHSIYCIVIRAFEVQTVLDHLTEMKAGYRNAVYSRHDVSPSICVKLSTISTWSTWSNIYAEHC